MSGYAIAATWLTMVVIIICAPVALVWCAAQVKRGRR